MNSEIDPNGEILLNFKPTNFMISNTIYDELAKYFLSKYSDKCCLDGAPNLTTILTNICYSISDKKCQNTIFANIVEIFNNLDDKNFAKNAWYNINKNIENIMNVYDECNEIINTWRRVYKLNHIKEKIDGDF